MDTSAEVRGELRAEPAKSQFLTLRTLLLRGAAGSSLFLWIPLVLAFLGLLLSFWCLRYKGSGGAAASLLDSQQLPQATDKTQGLWPPPAPAMSKEPTREPKPWKHSMLCLPPAKEGAASQDSASQADDDQGPPPICPALILPSTEASFMLPLDDVMKSQGKFDIMGPSGRKLLSVFVGSAPRGRRCVAVLPLNSEDPRCTIFSPDVGRSDMDINGRRGQSYGTLRASEEFSNCYVLQVSGRAAMHLRVQDADALILMATTVSGRVLATGGPLDAAKPSSEFAPEEHSPSASKIWRLQIKPGMDAVLMLSCMLALGVFQLGGQSREEYTDGPADWER